jgi:hypothetical protein
MGDRTLTPHRRSLVILIAIVIMSGLIRIGLLALLSGHPERAIAPDTSTVLAQVGMHLP